MENNDIVISVQYFAALRDWANRTEESVRVPKNSVALDVYRTLAERYGFQLSAEHVRVAINDEFSDFSQKLFGGEKLVFIPPVAGG